MYNAFGVEHEPISKVGPFPAGALKAPKPPTVGPPKTPSTGVVSPFPAAAFGKPGTKPASLKPVGLTNKVRDYTKRNPLKALGMAGGAGAAGGYAASQYGGTRY